MGAKDVAIPSWLRTTKDGDWISMWGEGIGRQVSDLL